MPDQTPNKSCGRCLLEKNWGKGQCKHFREWQSVQGPGFVIPKSCDTETPRYRRVSKAFLDQKGWNCQARTRKQWEVSGCKESTIVLWKWLGREKWLCGSHRLQLRLWQMGFTTRSWYLKSLGFSIMALWAPHLCAQARFPHCPALLLILDLGCHWKLSAEKGNGRCRSWNNLSHIL